MRGWAQLIGTGKCAPSYCTMQPIIPPPLPPVLDVSRPLCIACMLQDSCNAAVDLYNAGADHEDAFERMFAAKVGGLHRQYRRRRLPGRRSAYILKHSAAPAGPGSPP